MKAGTSSKVYVERPEILDDLIGTIDSPTPSRRTGSRVHEMPSVSIKSTETHLKLLKERQQLINSQTEAAMKQNIQKSLQRAHEKQEKQFPIILSNVDKAISFLDTIDKDISLHDETQKNKVRRQFEDWNSTVHGNIQKKISKGINEMDAKTLNKKKNDDYEKFLNITNRKPAIFRDIIIESEYDPLEPNRRCIKARTGLLKDPVKLDAQKAAAENSMLGTNNGGMQPKQKLGKETLPVELWASGQIEATPYGTFARMMNKKDRSANAGQLQPDTLNKKSNTVNSNVVFDHFNYPTGREAINKEMPRGKRIEPVTIYVKPQPKLPPDVYKDIAEIKPPENASWANVKD